MIRRLGPKKGISQTLEVVLLIVVTLVAMGTVATYFFGILGHSSLSTGLQITSAQIVGGVVNIQVQNTGSGSIEKLDASITPAAGQLSAPASPSTITFSSSHLAPGQSTSGGATFSVNPAGYTYIISVTATYANNQTYTTTTEVTAE